MTDAPKCEICGMVMQRADYLLLTHPPKEVFVCPRGGPDSREHALAKECAELREALQKIKLREEGNRMAASEMDGVEYGPSYAEFTADAALAKAAPLLEVKP